MAVVAARKCHLPPRSMAARRKTVGREEERCQETVQGEMVRGERVAGREEGGEQAARHPEPQR